jgi:hypothetical protein
VHSHVVLCDVTPSQPMPPESMQLPGSTDALPAPNAVDDSQIAVPDRSQVLASNSESGKEPLPRLMAVVDYTYVLGRAGAGFVAYSAAAIVFVEPVIDAWPTELVAGILAVMVAFGGVVTGLRLGWIQEALMVCTPDGRKSLRGRGRASREG